MNIDVHTSRECGMKSFREWKQDYIDRVPDDWNRWLLVVHACLESMEGSSGAEHSGYQARYQQTLDDKAQPLYDKARSLGVSFSPCRSVDDILSLKESLSKHVLLVQEWEKLSARFAEEGVSFPQEEGVCTAEKLESLHKHLRGVLAQRKAQTDLERRWNNILKSRKELGLRDSLPKNLEEKYLRSCEEVLSNRRSLLRLMESRVEKGKRLDLSVRSAMVYVEDKIEAQILENQIEERAPL